MVRVAILLGSLLFVIFVPVVGGREWTVATDGSGDFTEVSVACLAAASGDTISILPGAYAEPDEDILVEDKQFLLRGLGATPEQTSLQLVLMFSRCVGTRIQNLRFHDSPRGALSLWHGETHIENCLFERNGGNQHLGEGGAIYTATLNTQIVIVEDSSFIGNQAPGTLSGKGGAIYGTPCQLTIRRCSFIENTATHSGGALIAGDGSLIEDSLFLRNSAPHGAAITLYDSSILTRCTFVDNVVTADDGGRGRNRRQSHLARTLHLRWHTGWSCTRMLSLLRNNMFLLLDE